MNNIRLLSRLLDYRICSDRVQVTYFNACEYFVSFYVLERTPHVTSDDHVKYMLTSEHTSCLYYF